MNLSYIRPATTAEVNLYLQIKQEPNNFEYWKNIIQNNCWLIEINHGFTWYDLRQIRELVKNYHHPYFLMKDPERNQLLLDLMDRVIAAGNTPPLKAPAIESKASTQDVVQLTLL